MEITFTKNVTLEFFPCSILNYENPEDGKVLRTRTYLSGEKIILSIHHVFHDDDIEFFDGQNGYVLINKDCFQKTPEYYWGIKQYE